MGLCLGKTSPSPWPDLPPELAGLILSRLLCHVDRNSFSLVCRGWRLAGQQQRTLVPPAMPGINLGRGLYYNLAADGNGKAWCRFATPKGCHAGASFGGWLMYEHNRSHLCFLRDPFSQGTPTIEFPALSIPLIGGALHILDDPLKRWHGPYNDLLVCTSHLLVAIFFHRNGLFSIQTCSVSGSTKTTEPTNLLCLNIPV
jgi:hypothetical protein